MRRAFVSAFVIAVATLTLLAALGPPARAQTRRRPSSSSSRGAAADSRPQLDGVYRIDVSRSDRLYSVVAGASSNLPYGEQQRFFIDLAVRLTPPDLLAIEREGRTVRLGSSRAPRITLVADGVVRSERFSDGRNVRTRVALEGEMLSFTSDGRAEDNFSVIFRPFDDGRRLRVTRRITAEQLTEPLVIQSVYNKISERPRWDIYGETLLASEREGDDTPARDASDDDEGRDTPADGTGPGAARVRATSPESASVSARSERGEADVLREALAEWVEATNARDTERQMSFYMPELEAFYLARRVPRRDVRIEKARVFATAELVEVRAAEPEIIFRDAGRTAVMRFRKRYRIENGPRQSRRGEVVQELRWRRTNNGWKIFSERDVRVIR
jgi:ketosteroid isomerase-like protein